MKQLILALWCASAFGSAHAQLTGNFQFNVHYQGLDREVAAWIPSNYDSTMVWPVLIALHGFSMTASDMRTSMQPVCQQQGMLLFCLDGAGNRHDDDLGGDEIHTVSALLDSAKALYNIDTCSVYLSGFSYGGRESLYYGWGNPDLFAGVVALSPAIQSTADADNMLPVPWSSPFDYSASVTMPTCIVYGDQDANWIDAIEYFVDNMSNANALDTVLVATGVAHQLMYTGYVNNHISAFDFVSAHPGPTCSTTPSALAEYPATSEWPANQVGDQLVFNPGVVTEVQVFDLAGRLLHRQGASDTLELQQFEQAVLLVRVQTAGGKTFTKKLIR